MANPLSQITFDFSSEEEKDVKITGHEMPEEQQETMVQEEIDPRLEPEDPVTTVVEALEKRKACICCSAAMGSERNTRFSRTYLGA